MAAPVQLDPGFATYSAAINAHTPAATPTDWFTIQGKANFNIRITRIRISLRATAVAHYNVSILKYGALFTGGTSSPVTAVPHDSADPAAQALVKIWSSGLPTVGTTLIGAIAADSLPVSNNSTPTFYNEAAGLYTFSGRASKAPILRNAAQYIALNSNGVALGAGSLFDVSIEWTEESVPPIGQ